MTGAVRIQGPPGSWRQWLLPAHFRGVEFYVESGGVNGGRRTAIHEFPKRNVPYSEDMGRRARKWPIRGYLIISPWADKYPNAGWIGPDYTQRRNSLIAALEMDGPGTLQHPTLGFEQVMCTDYSYVESREKGGYCVFEMMFVEAGSPVVFDTGTASASQVSSAVTALANVTITTLDQNLVGSPSVNLVSGKLFQ